MERTELYKNRDLAYMFMEQYRSGDFRELDKYRIDISTISETKKEGKRIFLCNNYILLYSGIPKEMNILRRVAWKARWNTAYNESISDL